MPPPPADDIAYIRANLEALATKVEEQHRENREAHQGIFKHLDSFDKRLGSIERQPLIVLGEDARGVCRSIITASVMALAAWLAWLWARFHRL